MRDFSKVSPLVWGSKKFKTLNHDARLLYLYLLTCTHVNAIGCYRLPLAYANDDLGFDTLGSMADLISIGLVKYDATETMVFVLNYIRFNAPMNINHARWMVKEARAVQNQEFSTDLIELIRAVCADKDWNGMATLFPTQITVDEPLPNGCPTGNTQDQTKPDSNQTKTPPQDGERSLPAATGGKPVPDSFNVLHYLTDDGLALAKMRAPKWDIYFLAGRYNNWLMTDQKVMPNISLNLAFPAWVLKFTKGKPPV